MTYKETLKKEQDRRKEFLDKGIIPGDNLRYVKFLNTRHHHEILPERLYLIRRIQKAIDPCEKQFYLNRYYLLEEMNPNKSWKEFVYGL
jgi:hypothetical protein